MSLGPRSLWLVIGVAVAARVAAACYLGDDLGDWPGVADQRTYHTLAERVRAGYGFTFAEGWWPATPAGQPTAHWSYLYVLFVAAVYELAGPHPLVVRLVQAVAVGVLQPYLTWRIARRLDERAAIVAAGAVAVYGYFVYYAAALMTEALYITAVLWVLHLALRLVERQSPAAQPGIRLWIWLGLAAAAAVHLRQMFLLCVPVVLLWIVRQLLVGQPAERCAATWRASAGGAAMVMLVAALTIAPWTLRNYRAFGEVVLLNTNAGFAFFWGNHPVHGYRFTPLLEPSVYGALIPDDLRGLNEAALDKALLVRAMEFVAAEPLRYLSLCAGRVVEYVKFWPTAESAAVSNVARLLSFGMMGPLMVLGITRVLRTGAAREQPVAALLIWLAAWHSAVYVLTWTLVRYRLPVDAMLMPLAGMGVVALMQRTGFPRWRPPSFLLAR